jgi:hypothetical protein
VQLHGQGILTCAWQAWHKASSGKKYKKKVLPVTAFELITGGALQKIGEFDSHNQAEASAAQQEYQENRKKTGSRYTLSVVCRQPMEPSNEPSKATASSSGGSYYFICTFQLGCAITDVDIKAKLDLRGTAAARKELKDWRRNQAGACS